VGVSRRALFGLVLATACTSEGALGSVHGDPPATSDDTTSPAEPPAVRDSGGASSSTSGGEVLDDGDGGTGGTGETPPRFVDATVEAGLADIVQAVHRTPPFCLLDRASTPEPLDFCVPERLTGGVAVGDYDDDGFVDLFLGALDGPGRLLHNEGDGSFVEVTRAAGLGGSGSSNAAAWADVDGDGDLDLYVSTFAAHRHLLFLNDGHGAFVEAAIARGVAMQSDAPILGTTPAFGDVDLDGDLDLFVGEWRPDDELGDAEHHVGLFENVADGHFVDVSEASGIDFASVAPLVDAKPGVYVFAPAFVDLDDDRFPDLAVAADFGTSRIYWNVAGSFAFEDGTVAAGVGSERNAMGSTFGDVDGDLRLDWFVSAIETPDFPELGNRMYIGAGSRAFVDATDTYGVRDGDWGWGAAFFDPDADGDLDVVMTAGWTMKEYEDDPMLFWQNDGALPFVERGAELGLRHVDQGRGLVVFDLENDGDEDVLVVHWAGTPLLLRNDGDPPGFLRVRTRGTIGNARGLGTRIEVTPTPGAPTQLRVVGVGQHFGGHGDPMPHFLFGDREGPPVHEVRITWPASGTTQVLHDVPRNDVLVVDEPLR
jgi:enediyne biosynthesis protein E4